MAHRLASMPIGSENYKWASAGHQISSSTDCIAYNRANREANRDYYRSKDFQRIYGISFAEYQRMLIAQRGVCAICEKPETKIEKGTLRLLSVDHDHTTGAIRGLLCANCNLGLGYFRDSQGTLRKAMHTSPALQRGIQWGRSCRRDGALVELHSLERAPLDTGNRSVD
jgi:hypothetical protein